MAEQSLVVVEPESHEYPEPMDMLEPEPIPTTGLPPALGDFTPYLCHIKTGQDIVSTVMAFSNKGTRLVSILAANGAVSGVSLRRHGDALVTHYKGSYDILRLSAAWPSEGGIGALSLTIGAGDGSGGVYAGEVAGVLRAASPPVQLVLATCCIPQPKLNTPFKRLTLAKRKYRPIKCGKCGGLGHNRRSCEKKNDEQVVLNDEDYDIL